MKKVFIYLVALVVNCASCIVHSSAQAPQGIPYQAVARNASGNLIALQAVSVRFSIIDSIATGTVVYSETFHPATNALGLFNLNIGQGTVVSGSFAAINWGTNNKFLKVELDPAGGSSYNDMGTTQMMSVPYALYSNSSGSIAVHVAVRAYKSATQSIPHEIATKVILDAVSFDTNNNFASSRFTATIPGYYQVNSCIYYKSATAGENHESIILKNGSVFSDGVQTGNGNDLTVEISDIAYLDIGDYIEMFAYTYSSGATIFNGSPYTFLSVSKIN